MKFVLLFGPQAVGKMTVGQELEKITDLKLLHNHMTIDLLVPFFGFTPEMWELSTLFRKEIFKSFSKSQEYGMIFSFVWAFDDQCDWDFLQEVTEMFQSQNGEIYYVELEADLEERLKRNKTTHRLEHKPTKRNLEVSELDLLKSMENKRLNSYEGEITHKNYLRINNMNINASEVAKIIKSHFEL